MSVKPTDQQLRDAIDKIFIKYDTDKSNTLEFNEVRSIIVDAFSNLNNNKKVSDDDVKKFMQAVDKNGDGKITKPELFLIFKQIIENHFDNPK